jgi:flagellar hook-length control protein FliK
MRVEVVTRSEPVVSRPTSTLTPNAAVAAEAVQNGNQQTGAGAGQNQTGGIPLNQNQAGLPQAGSPMDPAASFSQALRQARADIDGGGQAAERGNASGAEARPVAGASNTSATSGAQAAARTAPAAPPRPTPPLPVTEQVAVRITNAPLAGTERLQIQLRPAHLGRVEVQLDFNADGRVIATVTADRPETLSQLQRDAGALDRALQQAGLDTDSGSMNFNLRNGGQNSAGAGNDNGAGHGNALPGEETAEQGTELVQEGDQLALAGDDRGIDIRI